MEDLATLVAMTVRTMRKTGGIGLAARRLAASSIDTVCSHLVQIIESGDAGEKCEAVCLLSRIAPPRAADAARSLLRDESSDVRQVSCVILEEVGDISDEIYVLELLRAETDGNVRLAAVSSLRQVGAADALAVVNGLIETDNSKDFEGRRVADVAKTVLPYIQARVITGGR